MQESLKCASHNLHKIFATNSTQSIYSILRSIKIIITGFDINIH